MEINYFAVFVAAATAFIIGGLWFSPLLFAKAWMREMGITAEKIAGTKKSDMTRAYGLSVLGSLVTAYALARFLELVEAETIYEGMRLAFWAWLGFVAVTTSLNSVLWEGKSWKLYGILVGQQLASFLSMSIILVLWK